MVVTSPRGYVAHAASAPLVEGPLPWVALRPTEVRIDVTHCSICRSDLHLLENDWGTSTFPLVPGHEVVGFVSEVGTAVSDRSVGARVGAGWYASNCGRCVHCTRDELQLCVAHDGTRFDRVGGFATSIIMDHRWVFAIPESMDSAGAAPLFCAGATTFAPLHRFASEGRRVGVVGIGGLGHLALQFAHAMRCEVTAFTSSLDKHKDARALGADHVVDPMDKDALAALRERLDLIVVTAPVDLDWSSYTQALARQGTMCLLAFPPSAVQIDPSWLIAGQRSVTGSVDATPSVTRTMLQFADAHGITARVEIRPMHEVNAAFDRLSAGEARYRIVLQR